jgi:hypothetical protein
LTAERGVTGLNIETVSPLPNERNDVMNDTTIQSEQDVLTYEVSDEALEAAAGTVTERAGALTLAFCSGLDSCPATAS